MPSSPTNSNRYEKQFTGENVNTWGVLLDQFLDMADASADGFVTIALTGNYSLSSHNYVTDEARNRAFMLTGSVASIVTIPSVSKVYVAWNASTAIQTITTGSGATVALQIGEIALLICDATNVKRVVATVMGAGPFSMAGPLDMGANKITSLAYATNPTDAASKQYADDLAFTANAGILPGQGGNAGKMLTTNGAVASWKQLTSADLSDTAARDAAALGVSVALAVAL